MARAGTFAGAAGLALALQLPFVYDGVPGGDSGELISEACLLGVAHPPGYPLFVLLTHAALRAVRALGCGPERCVAAWVANLLSTACGAAASGMVALTVHEILPALQRSTQAEDSAAKPRASSSEAVLVSVSAGVLFSLSPLVWAYTVAAEVFALNNMLCATLLWLTAFIGARAARRQQSPTAPPRGISARASKPTARKRRANRPAAPHHALEAATAEPEVDGLAKAAIAAGAAVAGLALCNQHTSSLFLVPLVSYVLLVLDRPLRPKWWLVYGAAFGLGLLPNLHLLLSAPKRNSWGDTTSWTGFVRHFLRQEYGTLQLSPHANAETESMVERTSEYFGEVLATGMGPPPILGGAVALIGAVSMFSARSHLVLSPTRALLATLVFYLVVFHSLANLPLSKPMPREVHRRFWIQPHLIVCVAFGAGVHRVRSVLPRWQWCTMLLAYLSITYSGRIHQAHDTSSATVGSYADALLNSLPQNALLVSHTDINLNAVRYKQECEGARPDVTHLSVQLIPYPWFRERQQSTFFSHVSFPPIFRNASTDRQSEANSQIVVGLALANLPRRRVFLDIHSLNDGLIGDFNSYPGGVHLVPYGLLWEVVLPSPELFADDGLAAWREQSRATLDGSITTLQLSPHPELGSWEFAVSCLRWDAEYQREIFLLATALKRPGTSFAMAALHESALRLADLIATVQESKTVSFPFADVARNAALATARWLSALEKLKSREAAAQLRPEAIRAARVALSAYSVLARKDDPARPQFLAVLEALALEPAGSPI